MVSDKTTIDIRDTLGKSPNLSVLFPHLQSRDSRHSHLVGPWVAEMMLVLNMPVSPVPVPYKRGWLSLFSPCKHPSLPKDCPGCVSTGCMTGKKTQVWLNPPSQEQLPAGS